MVILTLVEMAFGFSLFKGFYQILLMISWVLEHSSKK